MTADIEIVFVGITIFDHAGLEVVAVWWSKGCTDSGVGGIWRGDSEG